MDVLVSSFISFALLLPAAFLSFGLLETARTAFALETTAFYDARAAHLRIDRESARRRCWSDFEPTRNATGSSGSHPVIHHDGRSWTLARPTKAAHDMRETLKKLSLGVLDRPASPRVAR